MTNINDKPSYYDDQLNYRKYAKALAKVITDADTPFTIGISGEWGYGKTTLMNLIAYYLDNRFFYEKLEEFYEEIDDNEELEEKEKNDMKKNLYNLLIDVIKFYEIVKEDELKNYTNLDDLKNFFGGLINEKVNDTEFTSIFLNTWPFINSQDIGESIFEQIMYELIKIIKNNESEFKEVGKFLLKTIGATLKTIKFNGKLKLGIGEIGASFDPSKFSMDDMFVTDGIYKNFKIEIEDILNEITKRLGKLVIFIDDLDRLYPKQALEIILFMKNFLDVKNCIFVIGTDNEILKDGLEELYGKYENDNDKNGKEGYLKRVKENFFEKIYQLEFKIPNLTLKGVENYIENLLKEGDFLPTDIGKLKDYLEININKLNPRKLKKVFNTYLLIKNLISYDNNLSKSSDEYKSKLNKIIFELTVIYVLNFNLFEKIQKSNINNKFINLDELNAEEKRLTSGTDFSQLYRSNIYPVSEIINAFGVSEFNNTDIIEKSSKILFYIDNINDYYNDIVQNNLLKDIGLYLKNKYQAIKKKDNTEANELKKVEGYVRSIIEKTYEKDLIIQQESYAKKEDTDKWKNLKLLVDIFDIYIDLENSKSTIVKVVKYLYAKK